MNAPTQRDRLGAWMLGLAAVVVVAAILAAFVVGGTPSERRAMRLDDRRVSDLARLSREIDRYFKRE